MPIFRISPKVTIPLNGGMRMERTIRPIEVPVPFGTRPFDSVANRNRVKTRLAAHGYDFTGHESYLTQGFFDVKQI